MRSLIMVLFVLAAIAGVFEQAHAQQILGDYVEARNADVYTGPCFANAEAGFVGDQAILAWRIQRGSWEGIRLDGLSVVGIVKARATLGDPQGKPYPAKALVVVDERANREQREALLRFAQTMAGELLGNVVRVVAAPIRFDVRDEGEHAARAIVRAGEWARIETRPLNEQDHICGNEEIFYPPLAPVQHAMPAVAVLNQFRGDGLGVTWTISGKRSAFVGHFAR
ncbi:MAG: DUF1326 domain-containing protein [Blastocatellia bacterium]|nr:DUF1326 domain-containing protein [Blastocatellia bacterium]MCS7156410.1 DUF1326 domain-containing protein [Blastocatellia bacterium]MCX7751239.1 DUF1326 domain-containing protein [Blastocatellia bacterium]MDW8168950.1 DUF1326 domain-containing protein [Acidobacteriota bacterium]MDW8256711.1 DUF1326 domain-containing protein [Acidobacteriota bacterium]